ncbi:MAG: DNA polymerase III subunit gamma/tau C-terminal domain-containing protein, partial [Ostreibacterium sp.]
CVEENSPSITSEKPIEDVPPWQSRAQNAFSEDAENINKDDDRESKSDAVLDGNQVKTTTLKETIQSPSIVSLENFNWQTAINDMVLSDYTLHFVQLGILKLGELDIGVEAILDLSPIHEVMVTEECIVELKQALQDYLGQPVRVSVNLTEVYEQTPADYQRQKQEKIQDNQLKQFKYDPIVLSLVQAFDAQIIEKTVKSMEKN